MGNSHRFHPLGQDSLHSHCIFDRSG